MIECAAPTRRHRRQAGVATLEFVLVMLPLAMMMVTVLTIAIWVFVIDEAQGAVAEAALVGAQPTYTGDPTDVQQGFASASTITVGLPPPGGSGEDEAAAQWASDIMAPSLGWYQNPAVTLTRTITPGGVPGYLIGLYSVTFTGTLNPLLASGIPLASRIPSIPVSVTAAQPFRVPGAQASG